MSKCIGLICYSEDCKESFLRGEKLRHLNPNSDPTLALKYSETPFAYSRAMNRCIEAALKLPEWEYAILMDADAVFLGMTKPPESGFSACRRYDPDHDEPESEFLTRAKNWRDSSSYFVVRRDILEQPWCRFCEEMEIYGYEDFDFRNCVMRRYYGDWCDAAAIHLFHPRRCEVNMENWRIYCERYKSLHGINPKGFGEL